MKEKIKGCHVRLPYDLWSFIKKESISQEKSMNYIVINCLEKYKKAQEKKN